MSINKLVSIYDSVFNAMKNMGVDITHDTPTYTRWAEEAEREIGSYYGWKKINTVLTIDHCRAKLPCGAMRVKYAIMGDHGCECDDLIGNVFSFLSGNQTSRDEGGFLVVDVAQDGNYYCGGTRWEVQNNHLVFNSDLDGQKVTIQYLGYQTDCHGMLEVNENHVTAITNYIMWQHAIRSRFSPVKMDHTDVRYFETLWIDAKLSARADDSELSETERAEIVAMLNSPYIGWGLEAGMHSPNEYYGPY